MAGTTEHEVDVARNPGCAVGLLWKLNAVFIVLKLEAKISSASEWIAQVKNVSRFM